MGDLWERYTSPAAYVFEALRALPFLVFSRIRRTTNAPMVALAFLMLFASFGGSPRLWLNAVIPALAVLATFLLRDAYQDLSLSPARRAIGDGVAVALSAVATQAVLAVARPELLLTRWGVVDRLADVPGPHRRTAGRPGSQPTRIARGRHRALARRATRRDAAGGTGSPGDTPR